MSIVTAAARSGSTGRLRLKDQLPLLALAVLALVSVLHALLDGNAGAAMTAVPALALAALLALRQWRQLGASPDLLLALATHPVGDTHLPGVLHRLPVSTGSLVHALLRQRQDLAHHLSAPSAADAENRKIRQALDVSTTAVMIADSDHVIRYLNQSMRTMLHHRREVLRERWPAFDPDHLEGSSIHQFHANPERIRGLLGQLRTMHHGRISVGPVHFSQLITPLSDDSGAPAGFIVEWTDRTAELALQGQVAGIIEEAARGQLDRRIAADGGNEFLAALGDGINHLLDILAGALGEVRQMFAALADGQLDARMAGSYQGVFAQIRDDANTTAGRLASIVAQIKDSSSTLDAVSAEIVAGNEDLSARTEQQAANLEETAASMDELTGTVQRNAENAGQANQLAIDAAAVAREGGERVQGVARTMNGIEQSSRRIADIISVIDGIAFQTNILALNAAVEAARAGDQGRGFAVVAGEVRTLAQRSATAAREIKELIDESVSRVDEGAREIGLATTTIGQVVQRVEQVTGLMGQIAAASREQSLGIGQVSQTISQMDQATQRNAALVEEATASARVMQQHVQALRQAVSVFRGQE